MLISHYTTDTGPATMVRVSQREALEIITSLAHQMRVGSPNTGRVEHYDSKTREYVSIAVVPDEGAR